MTHHRNVSRSMILAKSMNILKAKHVNESNSNSRLLGLKRNKGGEDQLNRVNTQTHTEERVLGQREHRI